MHEDQAALRAVTEEVEKAEDDVAMRKLQVQEMESQMRSEREEGMRVQKELDEARAVRQSVAGQLRDVRSV